MVRHNIAPYLRAADYVLTDDRRTLIIYEDKFSNIDNSKP